MSSDDPSRDPRSILPGAIAAVSSGAELDPMLVALLEGAVAGLGASTGAIFLQDPDRPGLTLAASTGLDAGAAAALAAAVQRPEHPFAVVARDRRPAFDQEAPTSNGDPASGAVLPLVVSAGGVEVGLGVVALTWAGSHATDPLEQEALVALAGIAALAADRARLGSTAAERSEWFERMAHTDPLTGLANERTVARVLELELARATRQASDVSLVIFDVDDFRAVNANEGHESGDAVLRQVGAALSGAVRLLDTVGRIGGDEFVLIAPGAADVLVSDRIVQEVKSLPAVAGRSVSISAGVARFPEDGGDSEALIQAAKDALTRAKAMGRGSVASNEAVADR